MKAGKLVVEKHTEDVWSLTCAIRSEGVPRSLLRNGKRRKEELIKSQTKQREKVVEGNCEVDASSTLGGGHLLQLDDKNVSLTSGCDLRLKDANAGGIVGSAVSDRCGVAADRISLILVEVLLKTVLASVLIREPLSLLSWKVLTH